MPTPVSQTQRQEIFTLLNAGMDRQEIAAKIGVTPGQVAAIKAHMSMGTYGEGHDVEIEGELANELDIAFGLERDLQTALRKSIEQLEAGLTIIDNDKERMVSFGRIDITARDQSGAIVVIELKKDKADWKDIGQILSYMGDLSDGVTSVRGILVAQDFTPRVVAAARVAPNVKLMKYGFRFSFETISTALIPPANSP